MDSTSVVAKTVYDERARELVASLRRNADSIERGEFNRVSALVLVMLRDVPRSEDPKVFDEKVSVFGIGGTNYWHSIGMLQGGIAQLTALIPE